MAVSNKVFSYIIPLCILAFTKAKPPNIVFMVADDFGWNDISFRNPDIITPNLAGLAKEGIILNQSYVQPVCTPSRHAFMTGEYPFKAGLQHLVILPEQATCSPTNKKFLPQYLKGLGYATHAIGKWHLGFCDWGCTPTERGFDTFYGFYNGQEYYYNRSVAGGKDFRDGKQAIMPDTNKYSTYLYSDRARELVNNHNKTLPFFLYFPFQSVHEPIEVPAIYEQMYSNIQSEGRRKYSGMVTAMDDIVGNLTEVLKQNGMYDDTIFAFTADNGGWPAYYGNNYPLRGAKTTVFEGGTRATAFVSAPGRIKQPFIYDGMMHAVDWMPTILSMAGGKPDDKDIDGFDQWENIILNKTSSRNEFIYNLDDKFPPICGHAAIRVGDYKLIEGYPGQYQGWYKPEKYTTAKDDRYNTDIYSSDRNLNKGVGAVGRMLFNLKDDPYEHNDLSSTHREIADELSKKMAEYHAKMVPANFPGNTASASPTNYNGFWTPGWCKQ